jgi:YD repeat-containing protein
MAKDGSRRVELNSNPVATYDYDAEGRRVRRTVGATTTYYVYGADGQLMAEYGGTPNPVGTQYLVPDHLGSTRLILNAQGACAQRLDYAPYGAQLTRPGADCYTTPATGLPLFTGQMRDPESAAGTETGLDYFNARYFWATLGKVHEPRCPVRRSDIRRTRRAGICTGFAGPITIRMV